MPVKILSSNDNREEVSRYCVCFLTSFAGITIKSVRMVSSVVECYLNYASWIWDNKNPDYKHISQIAIFLHQGNAPFDKANTGTIYIDDMRLINEED